LRIACSNGLPQPAGRAAFEYVERAVGLARAGQVGGICTAPINKEAWREAGLPYPDPDAPPGRAGPRDVAYEAVEHISFDGCHYRTDIALAAAQEQHVSR